MGSATKARFRDLDAFGKFQSTHSRGVRQYQEAHQSLLPLNFNPRTHGECDVTNTIAVRDGKDISIHALTGSATKMAAYIT